MKFSTISILVSLAAFAWAAPTPHEEKQFKPVSHHHGHGGHKDPNFFFDKVQERSLEKRTKALLTKTTQHRGRNSKRADLTASPVEVHIDVPGTNIKRETGFQTFKDMHHKRDNAAETFKEMRHHGKLVRKDAAFKRTAAEPATQGSKTRRSRRSPDNGFQEFSSTHRGGHGGHGGHGH